LLFLGDGGYVTCSWHVCPNPDTFDALRLQGRNERDVEVNGMAAEFVGNASALRPLAVERLSVASDEWGVVGGACHNWIHSTHATLTAALEAATESKGAEND
jgi:hypothetical protein